jgi:hypothetical protein
MLKMVTSARERDDRCEEDDENAGHEENRKARLGRKSAPTSDAHEWKGIDVWSENPAVLGSRPIKQPADLL